MLNILTYKFNDMIHELSNKNLSSMGQNFDETVNQKVNRDSTMDNCGGNKVGLGEKVNLMNGDEGIQIEGEDVEVPKSNTVSESISAKIVETVLVEDVNGDEVVLFDEELMREGSEKWKNTVYDYFIGCNMPIYEVKYNLRRMWGKYGLKEIIVDEGGLCFIKFRSEEGENNMFNVPLEAWSTKGISTLSRRVLVELEAAKGLPESIEINYMDKQLKCKRTKWVKVEYVWKPILCNHYKVFGHNVSKCSARPRTASEIKQAKVSDNNEKMRDGFQEVKNRRDKHVENRGIYAGSKNGYQRAWNAPKDPMVDNRLVVDDYVKKKLQSTATETKDWSEDMIKYFKYSWEAIERRENENIKEEDVCEYTDLAVVFGITDEVNGEGDRFGNFC
ncbi:hypothetical protein Tco_1433452 [Tanacetum coccineum]